MSASITRLRPRTEVVKEALSHAHHWVIDEAQGQFSAGVCVECSERKMFRNWMAETDFITATDYAVGTGPNALAQSA